MNSDPVTVATVRLTISRETGKVLSEKVVAQREIRVIVLPDQVKDDEMPLIAHRIAKQIEAELNFPGQIKINMIRESRVADYAK